LEHFDQIIDAWREYFEKSVKIKTKPVRRKRSRPHPMLLSRNQLHLDSAGKVFERLGYGSLVETQFLGRNFRRL
jgi:hypothetical protein